MSCRVWLNGLVACMLMGAVLSGTAAAQKAEPRDQRAKMYRRLVISCTHDRARFCPAADQDGHSQFTCLKVFKADLALYCRKAVDALIARPTADTAFRH